MYWYAYCCLIWQLWREGQTTKLPSLDYTCMCFATGIYMIKIIIIGQASPAIGDIRLEKYEIMSDMRFYEVLIYYTDGINPPEWGGICGEVPSTTVDVLCRQLGFQPLSESPASTTWYVEPVYDSHPWAESQVAVMGGGCFKGVFN